MSDAEILCDERVATFVVTGSTVSDIRDAIRMNGPRGCMAFTDWTIRYVSVHVTVHIVTHLPNWISTRFASEDLHRSWNNFVVALKEHEAGHRDVAVSAGKAAQAALADLKQKGLLDEDSARAAFEHQIARFRKLEEDYDAITQHGLVDPRIRMFARTGG